MDENLFVLFVTMALINNFILVRFLGLCPFFGISKNIGNAISKKTGLKMVCSQNKKRTKSIPALRPGQEVPFEFGFKYHLTGSKRCGVWIDFEDKVDELDEDNNFKSFGFKVITGTVLD